MVREKVIEELEFIMNSEKVSAVPKQLTAQLLF